jgi:acyl carrier protein
MTDEMVEKIIFRALETLNEERAPDQQIEVSAKTNLFGVDAEIDSLSLVSVISDVETTINVEHNLSINLADDRAMSRAESPYTSVDTLKRYILELTQEELTK